MNRFITLTGIDGEELIVNIYAIASLQDVDGWTRINILDGDTVDTTASIDEIITLGEAVTASIINTDEMLAFRFRIGQEILAEAEGSDDSSRFNGAFATSEDIDAVISDIETRTGMCIGDFIKAGHRWMN